MECPNCNFQNVPGMRSCARCQSLLDFSSLAIDPPRAADAVMPLAVRHAAIRARISLGQTFADIARRSSSIFPQELNRPALLRSVIPGWGHCYLGYRWFGRVAIAIWLALIVTTLLLNGVADGWFMYFILVGWHSFVISLLLARVLSTQPILTRALVGLCMYALLNAAIYLPARWLFHGVARPFSLSGIGTTEVLRNGDTVIHTGRWNRPDSFRPGDLVVYDIHAISVPGAYIRGGVGVDRIVAGPGDAVSGADSTLLVNGAPLAASASPLRAPYRFPTFGISLGDDEYFIVPSLFNFQGQLPANARDLYIKACVVREADITGKVLWRSGPLSRFGSIDHPPAQARHPEEPRP
ncbi:MAG: hypothetical protein SFY69_13770 [Planctomycetota bacterium]|nr:hypothetical protein [Planctomycetota bacterium]